MSYTPTEWETADIVTAQRMNALETAVGELNMSYTPNTWSDGDILSASKMNALEQAVASGGGGSSDFSTAEVTVVNGLNIPVSASTARACETGDMGAGAPAMIYPEIDVMGSQSATFSIVLYKGKSVAIFYLESGTITVSGNITIVGEGDGIILEITGDGTITIS